jgi:hypothetical protein
MNSREIFKALSIKPTSSAGVDDLTRTGIIHRKDELACKSVTFRPITDTDAQSIDSSTGEDARQYQFPTPVFYSHFKKNDELTEEEQLRLDYIFRVAKLTFHEFKKLLLAAGIDPSGMGVRITNNRLDLSKIPDCYRSIFETMMKNNLSANSKARGTHKGLLPSFSQQLATDNALKKLQSLHGVHDIRIDQTSNNVYQLRRR